MAIFTSPLTLILFTFFYLLQNHHRHVSFTAAADCSNYTCGGEGGPTIHLPFYLISDEIPDIRAHQLFGLTCKNTSQAKFKFPYDDSGEFVVDTIDYMKRRVQLSDPDECLARRLQSSSAISGTLLSYDYYVEYQFLNCSMDVRGNVSTIPSFRKVGCLSEGRYSVFVASSESRVDPLEFVQYGCFDSWTEMVPTPWEWEGGTDGVGGGFPETFWLSWAEKIDCDTPDHPHDYGNFGFLHTKLAVILITAIPWVTCIFCALWRNAIRGHQADHSTTASPPDQLTVTVGGMDISAIELAFPKTQVGDKLPRLEDNICSICLCEYQTDETLRTITECNHYFHANCVDEWLKKNPTCPLCRNYQQHNK